MRILIALLVAASFAGCVAEDPQEPTPPPPEEPAPVQLADALAAWRIGATNANLAPLVAWGQGGGEEADAWGDYVFIDRGSTLYVLQMVWQNGTVVELVEVGSVSATAPKDVKVSDDGQWLFVGNDAQLSDAPVLSQVEEAPQGGGIYVFDVSNKEAPRQAAFEPVGPRRGPHMVFYHQHPDGRELVFGANADISIHSFDRSDRSLTELGRYAPNYVTDVNRDPDVIDAYYQTYAHDMFVMDDVGPDGTNAPQTLMYVANWDAGLRIVDVSDPSNPAELGGWNAFPDGHAGNLHTVATDWIGDRRITVGSVEVGFSVVGGTQYAQGSETSALYIWDTTDPTAIQLLSTWVNPDEAPAGRDMVQGEDITSTHNLQFEDGRVYMAHYGLGVFVIDVSDEDRLMAPEMVAFHREPGMNTWDVIVHQGVMLTSGAMGVQGLHFATDVLGPEGIRSRA